jgi:hypothetical protein
VLPIDLQSAMRNVYVRQANEAVKTVPAPEPVISEPLSPVHPAGGLVPAPMDRPNPQLLDGGQPVHGALAPGQTIVYVLDASGSMGLAGRFDRARRALLATLRCQPMDVRFQVVLYTGTARLLLPEPGGCVASTAENVERAAALLMNIEPVGRSAHDAGLRLAGTLNPEFILVFTDADDLPADAVRAVAARLARPPIISLAIVGSRVVSAPRAWQP